MNEQEQFEEKQAEFHRLMDEMLDRYKDLDETAKKKLEALAGKQLENIKEGQHLLEERE